MLKLNIIYLIIYRMDNLFYKLWLSDELKPRITENYYLTSRGLVSKDEKNKNKSSVFLNINQLDNQNYYYYESSYDIYELDCKDYINNNYKEEYEEIDNGDFKAISEGNEEIIYIISSSNIFIFEHSLNYQKILSYLIYKYKLDKIYTKDHISCFCKAIHFYFSGTKLVTTDPFINEMVREGLIGDKKDSENFKSGIYNYVLNYQTSLSSFPLFMFTRDNLKYNNYLVEIDQKEFINLVSNVSEFEFEDNYLELSDYYSFNGKFYKCKVNNEDVGIVAIARNATTFIYLECLAIFKKYRKKKYKDKLYSSYLIESIKYLANSFQKNAILTTQTDKLNSFYLKNGFKIVGKFFFD